MELEPDSKTPKISVIIPVYNASDMLHLCLEAVATSDYPNHECIVVDDSSTDTSVIIADEYGAKVIQLIDGPYGPARARNIGSQSAAGEFLYFIDSDVVIQPDTLSKVVKSLVNSTEYDAVFGSYDEDPGDGQFLSQYKNLAHHYVHQQAQTEGHTFWSGCGGIRRDVFLRMGGFDIERYPRPSIEDIELGIRLRTAGHRILVNKDIQVKHLKRWTLLNLIKTDMFDRAIPWTELILKERNLPNDLNLNRSQRVSAILLFFIMALLGVSMFIVNSTELILLLTVLFISLISSWQLSEGRYLFKMGMRAELFTYGLLLIITALGIYFELYSFLPIVGVLAVVIIFGKLKIDFSQSLKHKLFDLVIITFVIGYILLILSFPIWLIVLFLLPFSLIVMINRDYYYFFFRVRGPIFALAVIPFQMLYFFYSMVAFIWSNLNHLAANTLKLNPQK